MSAVDVHESASDALAAARRHRDIPSQRIDAIKLAVEFEKRVKKEMDDAVKAVFILLFAMADDDTGILPLARINDAERQIRATIFQAIQNLQEPYQDSIRDSAKLGIDYSEEEMKKVALIFTSLAFLQTSNEATQQIIRHGSRGVPFDDFSRRAAIDAVQNIRGQLSRAAVSKKPVTTLRKAVTDELVGKTTRSLGNRLMNTGTTDIGASYSESIRIWAEKNKKVLKLRFTLSEAHPRVDECDPYAGKLIDPGSPQSRIIPLHLGCLCTWVLESFDAHK